MEKMLIRKQYQERWVKKQRALWIAPCADDGTTVMDGKRGAAVAVNH
jgi:hypothetical protein